MPAKIETKPTFFTTGQAHWIWSDEGAHQRPRVASPSHYRVRRFRRTFTLQETKGYSLTLAVSADSRYILYLNGVRVDRGPAKGDIAHHFFRTLDLSALLRPGVNALSAIVMDYSPVRCYPPEMGAPGSVMTYSGGFILDGAVCDPARNEIADVRTGTHWKVQCDEAYTFQADGCPHGGFVGYFERFAAAKAPAAWTEPDFNDDAWPTARILYPGLRAEEYRDATSPYGLIESMVPPLEEAQPKRFQAVYLPGGQPAPTAWNEWVLGGKAITVPPNTRMAILLDAGDLETGFPTLRYEGGAGSELRLQYAEGLRLPWSDTSANLLGRPVDYSGVANMPSDDQTAWTMDPRGALAGWFDAVHPSGRPEPESYEPFHWRTFRFVQFSVETADAPLTLHALNYRFAAYPFAKEAFAFRCSDPTLERFADISWNTFRLCCHETFEDCPYYEQMQYSGDSQITSLIALAAAGDARLSRQALYHFAWSLRSDGITACRYPSTLPIVIPSWSLHYIFMAADYYTYTGDTNTLRDLLPSIRAILNWFERHADDTGLPARLPHWNIVDWSPRWDRGQPPGWDVGPTCIISAQYAFALQGAAALERALGNPDEAKAYETQHTRAVAAINACFWNAKRGLYEDRPGGPDASQYGQAWALLAGIAPPERHAQVMKAMIEDATLDPASFFGLYFVIRALEHCGAYERFPQVLHRWREMEAANLTTWAEDTTYWRSLCHAWSAFPLLEMITGVLGIQPVEPGSTVMRIKPHRLDLASAEGHVPTPYGPLSVAWRVENGMFHLRADAPSPIRLQVVMPDGHIHQPTTHVFEGSCTI